jgi:hypothetical protein
MAQIGSRLIDATAAKIAEDFFKAFEAHLQPAAQSSSAELGQASPVAVPDIPAKPPQDASVAKLLWLIGAVVLVAIIYFVIR